MVLRVTRIIVWYLITQYGIVCVTIWYYTASYGILLYGTVRSTLESSQCTGLLYVYCIVLYCAMFDVVRCLYCLYSGLFPLF